MKRTDDPVIVEQTYNKPVNSVWKSITEVGQMRHWFFGNIPSFKPEVGFETQFNVQSGNRNFLHQWRVTEVIPDRRVKYQWKYGGYPGDSFVDFELFEQGHLTKLRLTHQTLEDFPEDVPEFTRENCVQGWTYFIQESLQKYLDSQV